MKRLLVTLLFAFIGAAAGFVVPLASLLALAAVLSWWHGDPAAGGVLSFLMIPLGPIGVLTGIVMAVVRVNRWYTGKAGETKRKSDFDPGRRRLLTGMLVLLRKLPAGPQDVVQACIVLAHDLVPAARTLRSRIRWRT